MLRRTALFIITAILLQIVTSARAGVIQTSSPDFDLSPTQSSINIPQDWTGSVKVTVKSLQGFNGLVTLDGHLYNSSSWSTYVQRSDGPYLAPYGTSTAAVDVFVAPDEKLGCCHILEINASIGSVSHSANVSVTVTLPITKLEVHPPEVQIQAGGMNSTAYTVTSLNHFSGQINLEYDFCTRPNYCVIGTDNPEISLSINPPSIIVADGESANFTVTFATVIWTKSGTFRYGYKLTQPGGGYGDTTYVSVKVTPYTKPEFTLFVDHPVSEPFFPTLYLQNGGSNSTRLMLTSMNNFDKTVSLTVMSSTSFTASINPSEIRMQQNETTTATLTVYASPEAPAGAFLMSVNASSGLLHHSDLVAVTVLPFFTVKSSTTPVTVQPGSRASTDVELTTNGYLYNISFDTVPVNGISPTVSPTNLVPLFHKYRTVEISLTISVASTVQPGSYTIVVTATPSYIARVITRGSDSWIVKTVYLPSRSVSVPIDVVNPENVSSKSGVFELLSSFPLYLYGIAGISLVVLGLAIAVLRRGRVGPDKPSNVSLETGQIIPNLWKKVVFVLTD